LYYTTACCGTVTGILVLEVLGPGPKFLRENMVRLLTLCTRSGDLYAYVINVAYAKCIYLYWIPGKPEPHGSKAKQEVSVNPCLFNSSKSSLKCIRMTAAVYVNSVDLVSIHYARIYHGGRLHEEPQKSQNWP